MESKLKVLPFRSRLKLNLPQRRKGLREDSFLPSMQQMARWRSGNKVSRFFRHIFEYKHIKRLVGTNIAFFIVLGSALPTQSSGLENLPAENLFVTNNSVSIKTEGHIQYPLNRVRINQGYSFFHPAIDFGGNTGDPVVSIMEGTVAAVQYSNYGYGNAIIVSHGNGFTSLYAHLSKIKVKEGQKVTLETIIGEVGSTGRSSGAHLHLEVRDNGVAINPFVILP